MRRRSLLIAVVALGVTTVPAEAAPLPPSGTLDLAEAPATSVASWKADETGGLAGAAVAGIGDFDGDGKRDMAVGEPKRDTAAGKDSGAVHIVFDAGKSGRLGDPATTLTIRGARAGDQAGFDVTGVGDVNGDKLADILIGAPLAGPKADEKAEPAGEAYLVLGRPGRGEIDLAAPFSGIRIGGDQPGGWFGRSVGALPDVNGDGRPELVIGAPRRDAAGPKEDAGAAFVVFGRPVGDVATATLVEDGAGYRVDGAAPGVLAGRAVGGVGDMNGDGRPELLVTAPKDAAGAGAAYVLHGRAAPGVIDLAALGAQGFPIASTGAAARRDIGDWLGESITGLGDVNGDKLPDIAVGAHLADGPDRARGGLAYVVYGKAGTEPVSPADLGDRGFRIVGVGAGDNTGFAVAAAGDYNADGIDDVAVGAPFAAPLSRAVAGAAYVVFGAKERQKTEVDLAEIGPRGLRLAGVEGTTTGFALDGLGDVDGDGGDDLAIGQVGIGATYVADAISPKAGTVSVAFGASGKAGDIPGSEIKNDPGYDEAVKAGCTPATNVQAVVEDNGYTDGRADPERIRMVGLQGWVASPRNFGTVLGVSAFTEGEESQPLIEPTELTTGRVDTLKAVLRKGIVADDAFPGYDVMFSTLADDNPSAGARIMVVDGYLFKLIAKLKGLTDGSAPTYVIAIGDPPERNRFDIRQMRRVTNETKGRYYEARSPRQLERALQAIQSRIACDVDSDNRFADLDPGEEEEIADIETDDDTRSADITLTWRDDEEDYEIETIQVLSEDGDVLRELDDEEIDDAYDETSRTAVATARRGKTFRTLHLRRLGANRRLRVIVKAEKGSGRIYARVTQSRRRR